MSDLVERLRAHDMQTSPDWPDDAAKAAWMDDADDLLSEAATEITRLQKELERAREALENDRDESVWRFWNEKARYLAARLATAREDALEEAAKVADQFAVDWGLAYKTMTDQMSAAIRSLKDKEVAG